MSEIAHSEGDVAELDVTLGSQGAVPKASPYMASVANSLQQEQEQGQPVSDFCPQSSPSTPTPAEQREDGQTPPPPPPESSDDEEEGEREHTPNVPQNVAQEVVSQPTPAERDLLTAGDVSAQGSFRSLQERSAGQASVHRSDAVTPHSRVTSPSGVNTPREGVSPVLSGPGVSGVSGVSGVRGTPIMSPVDDRQSTQHSRRTSLAESRSRRSSVAESVQSSRSVQDGRSTTGVQSDHPHSDVLRPSESASQARRLSQASHSHTPNMLSGSASRMSLSQGGSRRASQVSRGGQSGGVQSAVQSSRGGVQESQLEEEASMTLRSQVSEKQSPLPYVLPYAEEFSSASEVKLEDSRTPKDTPEAYATPTSGENAYDSQPHPPANSMHERVSASGASGQRSSPTFFQSSAIPPPAEPITKHPASALSSPISNRASPQTKNKQFRRTQQPQQQPPPPVQARDPVWEAACTLWDAKVAEMSTKRAHMTELARHKEASRSMKLQVKDEVRQLQETERREQFHAREHYPSKRFDTNIVSPQKGYNVHSLGTTESFTKYKEVYGVVPASAEVQAEGSPARGRSASPPRRRSKSRDLSPNSPHGMRTLAQTKTLLERSRLQPDTENSLDAVARLKRLKRLSSNTSSLLTCPRGSFSNKTSYCLNPRHPDWKISPEGTFMLPDGSVGNVIDQLSRPRN